MAKTIVIPYREKKYTLEFTRKTARALGDRGFILQELGVKPLTMVPMLFEGAFLANHPNVKGSVIDEIYYSLGDKTSLIEKLVEMYLDPVNALTDSEGDEKNGQWEASW